MKNLSFRGKVLPKITELVSGGTWIYPQFCLGPTASIQRIGDGEELVLLGSESQRVRLKLHQLLRLGSRI